jgi:peroxiredoxin
VPLLSDWSGDATRAFGVVREIPEIGVVATRSAFLIEDGETIREAWTLGRELPDIDAVIAAASAL